MGSAGDRPPAGDRPSPGAFPPRRCAATGSGTAGKARRGRWLGGSPRPRRSRGAGPGGPSPPRVLQPPGSSGSPNPGAEGARPVAALSPLPAPTRRGGLSREGEPASATGAPAFPGGPGRPSHGATALPLPPLLPRGEGRGRGGLSPVRPGRVAPSGPGGSWATPGPKKKKKPGSERTGSAAMSATHPTRLETRTKESNTCASRGLARKPPWRNEGEGRRWRRRAAGGGGCVGWVRGGVGGGAPARPPAVPSSRPLSLPPPFARRAPPRRPEVGSRGLSSPPRAHHRPVSPAAPGRWSRSARVRTRKMVNYAWAGRSQRKLWWRSVAVLTCKSVVRPGYRGERLIEPSSSWFPPKFPSG